MATAAETPVQQHSRLAGEFEALRHVHPDERTAEQKARLVVLAKDLRGILAVPPAGYAMPKLAADLMAHAAEHGWLSSAQWSAPGYIGDPFVKVEVGRRLDELEREHHRGDRWLYQLTWSSRGCAPGKVKLFRAGLAQTPDSPSWSDAPSVKAIAAVITGNPGPRPTTTRPAVIPAAGHPHRARRTA